MFLNYLRFKLNNYWEVQGGRVQSTAGKEGLFSLKISFQNLGKWNLDKNYEICF